MNNTYTPIDWNGILIVAEWPDRLPNSNTPMPLHPDVVDFLAASLRSYNIDLYQCQVTTVSPHIPPRQSVDNWFLTKTAAKKAIVPEFFGKYPVPELRTEVLALRERISSIKPKAILTLGNLALWALTTEWGIMSWRGSCFSFPASSIPLLPTIAPATILKKYEWRILFLRDLMRLSYAARHGHHAPAPEYNFQLYPTSAEIKERLSRLAVQAYKGEIRLAVDIETVPPFLGCVGLAWSSTEALSFPLYEWDERLQQIVPATKYTIDDLAQIAFALKLLLEHPNVTIVGQNYSYDTQYLLSYWGIKPTRYLWDTMLTHNVLHPSLPKGLDVLSSLYLDYHMYWKAEGKLFEYGVHSLDRLLQYNAKDCCITWAICQEQLTSLTEQQHALVQEKMRWAHNAIYAMMQGLPWDKAKAGSFFLDISDALAKYEQWFIDVMPPELLPQLKTKKPSPWYRSPSQQMTLFYNTFGLKPVINRKTFQPTVDDNALAKLRTRDPILRPLFDNLARYRSLNIASNICRTAADPDGQIRCNYSIAGTLTHRFSSSENAFGNGTNLQNISTGEDAEILDEIKELRKAGHAGTESELRTLARQRLFGEYPALTELPNMRELIVCPPGYVLCDVDLARADAQAVAGHAGDLDLLNHFDDPEWDMHEANAKDICRIMGWSYHRPKHRPMAKAGVHAMNYYVQARTLATTLGCSVSEAQQIIDAWFAAHPLLLDWQQHTIDQLQINQTVTNVWGFSITYYNRLSIKMVQEALAWLGQSTIAILINKIWQRLELSPWLPTELYNTYPDHDKRLHFPSVRLQVHDSLAFLLTQQEFATQRPALKQAMRVEVPFPCKPNHVIDVGLKASSLNWGAVKNVSWS